MLAPRELRADRSPVWVIGRERSAEAQDQLRERALTAQ
jgi:hypothetical protein